MKEYVKVQKHVWIGIMLGNFGSILQYFERHGMPVTGAPLVLYGLGVILIGIGMYRHTKR